VRVVLRVKTAQEYQDIALSSLWHFWRICALWGRKSLRVRGLLRCCEVRLTPTVTENSEERHYVSCSVRYSDWYMYRLP